MKPTLRYHDDLIQRLKDPKYAIGYLNACLADEDDGVFLLALRNVAEAHGGIRQLSKKAGPNREHLFRMLSKTGNPRLESIRHLIDALGLRLMLVDKKHSKLQRAA